jgi:hypothetical protein
MTFPFKTTPEIRDAYLAHQAYCSAGSAWLIRNDPEGQNEQVFIQEIIDQVQAVAEEHFGDDEDAYWQFHDEWELSETNGSWYEVLEQEFEEAAE